VIADIMAMDPAFEIAIQASEEFYTYDALKNEREEIQRKIESLGQGKEDLDKVCRLLESIYGSLC
jgi:hypothetical protein